MIEHDESEIIELCRKLGVSQKILGRAGMQTQVMLNGSNLSLTDATLLTIVRALLSSVDLLLLSNLLDVVGEERSGLRLGLGSLGLGSLGLGSLGLGAWIWAA